MFKSLLCRTQLTYSVQVPNLISNLEVSFKLCIGLSIQAWNTLTDGNNQPSFVVPAGGVTSNLYKYTLVFSSSIFLFCFIFYI